MRGWLAGLVRRGGAPPETRGEVRTIELGGAMAVVFSRAEGVVTEAYVGIRGTPSRVVRDMAAERLTRQQLAAGEEPWLPEVAARLAGGPAGPTPPPPSAPHDDAAPT